MIAPHFARQATAQTAGRNDATNFLPPHTNGDRIPSLAGPTLPALERIPTRARLSVPARNVPGQATSDVVTDVASKSAETHIRRAHVPPKAIRHPEMTAPLDHHVRPTAVIHTHPECARIHAMITQDRKPTGMPGELRARHFAPGPTPDRNLKRGRIVRPSGLGRTVDTNVTSGHIRNAPPTPRSAALIASHPI